MEATRHMEIPLESIEASKTNPSGRATSAELQELAASIREVGILQPVLVRPHPKHTGRFELVFGERRWRAAQLAGLTTLRADVRELSNDEALAMQTVENLQREGLSPLQESELFHRLVKLPGFDVAKVAARVGRSVAYVYDRLKLTGLVPAARAHFEAGRLTAGHLVVLARLEPKHQKLALDPVAKACFDYEHTLFDPLDKDREGRDERVRPRSVRELQAWIDTHVRFDPRKADPMLFPVTAEEVARAQKVVPITFEYMLGPDVRSDERTFTERSWKRADGKHGSKTCEHGVTGCVVAGVHRGEAFTVCVAKEKCRTHWGTEIRAREKRAKEREAAIAKSGGKGKAASGTKAAPEPKHDREMEAAVEAAENAARDVAALAVAEKARGLTPDTFIRLMAQKLGYEIRSGMNLLGIKVSGKGGTKQWIGKAKLAEVMGAWAGGYVAESFDHEEFADLFGVHWKGLIKQHREAAIAELKAKRAAAAKAPAAEKPAAGKPAKKAAKPKRDKAGAR